MSAYMEIVKSSPVLKFNFSLWGDIIEEEGELPSVVVKCTTGLSITSLKDTYLRDPVVPAVVGFKNSVS